MTLRLQLNKKHRLIPQAWRAILGSLVIAFTPAWALEFKVVNAPSVARDAPSVRGKEIFILPHGMPVEILHTYSEWVKVRDASGDQFWTESKNLASARSIITTKASKLYASPNAPTALYSVDKGVVFEWLETLPAGWVKVKHQDGTTGYIRSTDAWGE